MFDNRTSALRREIYKFHASAVPRSSYLDRLLGGEAARSADGGGLFTVAKHPYRCSRSAPYESVRFASVEKSALRANFEQTAPPSRREGTPPNLGGD
jgi:hypothetical protein